MTLTSIPPDTHNERVTRVDMHCHSTASQVSKLGVQRAAGLPECATPPEEVYALAKRRGMDFVTITDHDTIDGAMQIADRPDVFISEELTAHFRGEPAMAVHVLCYDITPDDHVWLQANAHDVELCAAYMYERDIACAFAHPYYIVGATPLTARHRRRLSELFGVWEVRNGARAPALNRPAATYVATRDSIGIGGSDDHAGVDIGRTYTQAPAAATPQEFLAHMRAGRVRARGAQGSAAKWAHAAIVLAARSLEPEEREGREEDTRASILAGEEHPTAAARASVVGSEPTPPRPDPDSPPDPTPTRRVRPASRPDPKRVMTMVRHRFGRGGLPGGRPLPAESLAGRGRARPPRHTRADRLHAGRILQPRRPLPARVPPT
jgi:predicted metal-dependent phosphoesterase TrpH